MSQQQKKSLMTLSAAVCVALALGAPGAMAGVVQNSNPLTANPGEGDCGTVAGDTTACIGAWDIGSATNDNVTVDLIGADGVTFLPPSFYPSTGSYTPMSDGDYALSSVYSDSTKTSLMAKIASKVWPIGEPTGIKAVNGDTLVKNGKPENCLINTAFLEGAYLDAISTGGTPEPVICSSDFQSHKRFKIAMQPATVDSVTSGDGHPIDLVFNASNNSAITPYQVFSKINNYTGKRLAGYKIEVGVGGGGTGIPFQTATDLGISGQLYLSLGVGEDATSTPAGDDLFTSDGLATFSHGLFGAIELPHFPSEGFFSNTTAFYPVGQACTTGGVDTACPTNVVVASGASIPASDTIFTTGVLSSNYTSLLGSWLPSDWAPEGIFHDDDNDPSTDPVLVAWWNGKEWEKGQADNFAPVTQAEFNTWASDSSYSEDVIEDVLNLGINYIVHVGDINGATGTGSFAGSPNFTIRIIPIVAADQTAPAWVGTTPAPLVVTPITTTTTSSSGGGGCTVGGDGRFDPIFPALLLAGLGFLGLRRFSRKS